jgi:hypothetical protein
LRVGEARLVDVAREVEDRRLTFAERTHHRRSRSRQAQAADPAGARFQIDEDGRRDEHASTTSPQEHHALQWEVCNRALFLVRACGLEPLTDQLDGFGQRAWAEAEGALAPE